MKFRRLSEGFALPTVVISAVVLFAVLVAAMSNVSSTRTTLDTQYYEALARDATESGANYASACFKSNANTSTWGSNTLAPNKSCAGVVVTGPSAYVVQSTRYRTTYSVSPVTSAAEGTQTATVTGTVELLRADNTVWKTFTKSIIVRIGGQIGTYQVVFGYLAEGTDGAFFGNIGADGKMRTVGFNNQGQLGNGTTSSTLTPTTFAIPSQSPVVKGYSNFLSMGSAMYAVTADGFAWGAGANESGQIGNGSISTAVTTPAKVILPAGVTVVGAAISINTNYFVGSDNNVYAAGACDYGMLGSGYTIAGCANKSTPVRVALPTPNTSLPNTIPTSNIVTDRLNTYIRMAGGAVYGWGANDYGQIGGDTFADQSTPVKIGAFGDSGQPVATQIATDGVTLFVLDNTGHVSSLGYNSYGSMGTPTMSLRLVRASICIDNAYADGVTIQLYACNGTAAQKFQLRTNDTVYYAQSNKCLDNANADGVTLRLWSCNGTAAQVFQWDPVSGTLYNPNSNKCVDDKNGAGTNLWLYPCNNTDSQEFRGYNGNLTAFDTSSSGLIQKISTDQWSLSCLTYGKEVWSAGINTGGQFGNNDIAAYSPTPAKFGMSVPAADLYETNSYAGSNYLYQNLYVIGTDGRVYGSGSNAFGQLGNGSAYDHESTPVAMSVIDGATVDAAQVQSGYGTAVIFTTNGGVYTVGNNSNGQLGDGTTTNSAVPIKAKYINDLKMIAY